VADLTGKIRHALPEVSWPTAVQAAASLLFAPIRIGAGLVLASRTWVPAMVPWRATEEGFVTPAILDWYARFAEGRPGALVVEATGIRDIKSGPLLRISHDRFLPGLSELVETVRRHSGGATRLLIQISDFLSVKRRVERATYLRRFLTVTERHRAALGEQLGADWSTVPEAALRDRLLSAGDELLRAVLSPREWRDMEVGYREEVNDLHLPQVRELPEVLPGWFAEAAERARRAGFDGVELHYAHAYTMASFLSRRNTRDDGYGGAREHRVRLPLEVLAAVRARVGADYCVGCRYLGHEVIRDGSDLEDAVWFGTQFAAAGMDYLSISKGGKFEDARQPKVGHAVYPYTGPSGLECMPTVWSDARGPFGRNVLLATAIRRAVRDAGYTTPVVTAGAIASFQQMEQILLRGEADLCAAARQSLADPDWFAKIRSGRGDAIRRCVFTNYCEGLDQVHKEVTCQLWDRQFEPEDEVALAKDGKRRLVAPREKEGVDSERRP
jgi:2,4-dienoyl-CoA reductase-like NADH-dependent reductase (Old Yellow Enzyme family)